MSSSLVLSLSALFTSAPVEAASAVAFAGLLAVVFVALIRLVAQDGYGHREAPPSRTEWSANGLPSRPYGV